VTSRETVGEELLRPEEMGQIGPREGPAQEARTVGLDRLRIVEEAPPELRKRKIEIVDYRQQVEKLESLGAEMLVWAEGADKAKGKNRLELHSADELAIYTAPASPAELQAALASATPGELIGPVAHGAGHMLLQLRVKAEPSPEDPELGRRAAAVLAARNVDREN